MNARFGVMECLMDSLMDSQMQCAAGGGLVQTAQTVDRCAVNA